MVLIFPALVKAFLRKIRMSIHQRSIWRAISDMKELRGEDIGE
jgi:hypothetical protein